MSARKRTKNPEPKLGAGAAGAGTGTLLVLLARNLPDENPWKSWLVIAAPSATIFVSALWLWIRHLIRVYFTRLEVARLINQGKATLERAMQNPLTSAKHRETLRKRYEELELLQVDGYSHRLRILTIDSESPADDPTVA